MTYTKGKDGSERYSEAFSGVSGVFFAGIRSREETVVILLSAASIPSEDTFANYVVN